MTWTEFLELINKAGAAGGVIFGVCFYLFLRGNLRTARELQEHIQDCTERIAERDDRIAKLEQDRERLLDRAFESQRLGERSATRRARGVTQ